MKHEDRPFSYDGIHHWLKRNYGKANKCENSECKKKSTTFQWSLLKGKKYERKRENFWRLCVSCHRKYDMTDKAKRNMSLAHKGQKAWNKGKKGQTAWNKGKKGTHFSPKTEFKKGCVSIFKGKKHSEEAKEKMRKIRKKYWVDKNI